MVTVTKQRQHRLIVIPALSILLCICFVGLHLTINAYGRATYPCDYADAVNTCAAEFDLPPSLIYAVIRTESGFHPDAVSHAGAVGLMQVTEDTCRWALRRSSTQTEFNPQLLIIEQENIHYGSLILRLLITDFGNTETALAAYNAGQGHVREWLSNPAYSPNGQTLSHIPFEETATYVRRVLAAQKRYQQLYNIP